MCGKIRPENLKYSFYVYLGKKWEDHQSETRDWQVSFLNISVYSLTQVSPTYILRNCFRIHSGSWDFNEKRTNFIRPLYFQRYSGIHVRRKRARKIKDQDEVYVKVLLIIQVSKPFRIFSLLFLRLESVTKSCWLQVVWFPLQLSNTLNSRPCIITMVVIPVLDMLPQSPSCSKVVAFYSFKTKNQVAWKMWC